MLGVRVTLAPKYAQPVAGVSAVPIEGWLLDRDDCDSSADTLGMTMGSG
jgi:hypothetical protein